MPFKATHLVLAKLSAYNCRYVLRLPGFVLTRRNFFQQIFLSFSTWPDNQVPSLATCAGTQRPCITVWLPAACCLTKCFLTHCLAPKLSACVLTTQPTFLISGCPLSILMKVCPTVLLSPPPVESFRAGYQLSLQTRRPTAGALVR